MVFSIRLEEDLRSQNKLFDCGSNSQQQQQQQQQKATKNDRKSAILIQFFYQLEIGMGIAGKIIFVVLIIGGTHWIPFAFYKAVVLCQPDSNLLASGSSHALNKFPWMKWNNLLVRERHKYPDENCDFICMVVLFSVFFLYHLVVVVVASRLFYFCCRV